MFAKLKQVHRIWYSKIWNGYQKTPDSVIYQIKSSKSFLEQDIHALLHKSQEMDYVSCYVSFIRCYIKVKSKANQIIFIILIKNNYHLGFFTNLPTEINLSKKKNNTLMNKLYADQQYFCIFNIQLAKSHWYTTLSSQLPQSKNQNN